MSNLPSLLDCHSLDSIPLNQFFSLPGWHCECGQNKFQVIGKGNTGFVNEIYLECACGVRWIIISINGSWKIEKEE